MAYKKGRDHLIWTDNPYYMDYEDWKESVDEVLDEYEFDN